MLKKGTIKNVVTYYLDRDNDILLDALRQFFDRPKLGRGSKLEITHEEEGLFNEWLFFEYKLKTGKTILEDYYESNPQNLSKKDLSVYKDLQDNHYGMYRVERVIIAQGISLIDLQTNKKYYVRELSGSLGVEKGYIIFARVGKVGNHLELVGCNAATISVAINDQFLKEFNKSTDKLSPKHTRQFYSIEKDRRVKSSGNKIIPGQKEIEKSIIDLLKQTKSAFGLQDVKDAIYHEEDSDDMMKVVAMFDRGRPDELDNILELVTDAWNYFPHKSLNGKSPMEMREK